MTTWSELFSNIIPCLPMNLPYEAQDYLDDVEEKEEMVILPGQVMCQRGSCNYVECRGGPSAHSRTETSSSTYVSSDGTLLRKSRLIFPDTKEFQLSPQTQENSGGVNFSDSLEFELGSRTQENQGRKDLFELGSRTQENQGKKEEKKEEKKEGRNDLFELIPQMAESPDVFEFELTPRWPPSLEKIAEDVLYHAPMEIENEYMNLMTSFNPLLANYTEKSACIIESDTP